MTAKSSEITEAPVLGLVSAEQFLEIDPKFVLEVATGLEDITEIAPRYGLTEADVEALMVYKPFIIEVERLKSELYKSGKTFKLKASMMAEEVMDRVFRQALQEDIGITSRLDALRTLAKLADLEPKPSLNTQAAAGSGFSITINLGESKSVEVIDG